MNVLSVKNISVAFGQNIVLENVSFEVESGSLLAVIGPNGAGKTTLLKAILGLMPSSGNSSFFGEQNPKGRERLKRVAYVPQRAEIDWDFPLTVRDVVKQGRYRELGLFKRASKKDDDFVEHAIDAVGMLDFSDRQIGQLSGGQQQRVFLARAIAQNADLLFMDEPFQGVDAATEEAIINLLFGLRDEGKTVIAVHHDLSTVQRYFDEVLLLNRKLIAYGKVKETFNGENLQRAYGGKLTMLDTGQMMIG